MQTKQCQNSPHDPLEQEYTVQSEKEKMLAGELYDSSDPVLVAERRRARDLCRRFNALPASAPEEKASLLAELFGRPTDAHIVPTFQCDYGLNITLGRNVHFNFNCVILDVAKVVIGSNVLFGPSVQLYTASHPLDVELRRQGLEFGRPIVIGDDVWVGGNAVICPGVTIGAGAVIGAGSVVTRDVPPAVLAAGNPCRVIRPL